MKVEPRTRAGLLFALVPLAFLVGFVVYAGNRYEIPWMTLVTIALCGAAVPLTVMMFTITRD